MVKPKLPISAQKKSVTEKLSKPRRAALKPEGEPPDVAAINAEIQKFLRTPDDNGRALGSLKFGVYAFYDYDGEPIYIGQTFEGFGARLGRHLTGRRSDAVAKNILDPFEVAEVSIWPMDLYHLVEPNAPKGSPEEKDALRAIKHELNRAEYTLYGKVVEESRFNAVLNEKLPRETDPMTLPKQYRARIIPVDIFPQRKHPDTRIARRAQTIASLARVISERRVGKRLRTILLTQAKRLEALANARLQDFAGVPDTPDPEN